MHKERSIKKTIYVLRWNTLCVPLRFYYCRFMCCVRVCLYIETGVFLFALFQFIHVLNLIPLPKAELIARKTACARMHHVRIIETLFRCIFRIMVLKMCCSSSINSSICTALFKSNKHTHTHKHIHTLIEQ